jgi:hypothetical protein
MRMERLSRFVILTHTLPAGDPRPAHWDFMLEMAAVLRTWALASEPGREAPIAAQALADHRLHYLDYEGPISADRGEVSRWDSGQYSIESEQPGELVVRLLGSRLRGRATLRREDAENQRWRFSFVADSNSA